VIQPANRGCRECGYQLLCERLPDCVLLSIGHRSTLHRLHTHQLELRPDGDWSLSTLVAAAPGVD
jgi:putative ATP-binding cassette transporter